MDIKTRSSEDVVIFDIKGEIRRTDTAETTLHQMVKAQLERGRKDILLNFQGVEFIDSFGVGEILASFISVQNIGGKLKLAKISKKLYLIFQVTMLTRVLEIYDSEDAALGSFKKP